jgi:hypothetical protein
MYLTPSTYQALGLSVAAGYTVLGSFAVLLPATAARTYFNLGHAEGLWPFWNAGARASYTLVKSPGQNESGEDHGISLLMRMLGARDLSIAAAIFALDWRGEYKSVGTVILAGMVLCAVDVAVIWKQRGHAW